MQENVSKFGNLVDAYDTIRPRYSEVVLRMVRETLGDSTPLVLDLGCGTGISTRQLAETGIFAIGCDIDSEMISAAIAHRSRNTAYVHSEAGDLPFTDGLFDGVTFFNALHWFSDDESLKEIRRVLKPGSTLCAVQFEHTASFAKDHRTLIADRFPEEQAPQYSKRDFVELLTAAGFKDIHTSVVPETYTYTLDQFLLLIQSYSVWNQVPLSGQAEMREILRQHFESKLEGEYILDTVDVHVTIAGR